MYYNVKLGRMSYNIAQWVKGHFHSDCNLYVRLSKLFFVVCSDEHMNWSSNYGLAVSLGRSVQQFSIICSTTEDDQVSFRLANIFEENSASDITNTLSFPHLQALIDHYK